MSLKLSIPTTSIISDDPAQKPYTVYNILIRLPLREHSLPKRYSSFLSLHSDLTHHCNLPPPLNPPPKSFWSRTINSPTLTEDRRQALEKYLLAILEHPDPRWRASSVWRSWLNLPASYTATGITSSTAPQGTLALAGQTPTDPSVWLELHRELKTLLHDARLALAKRDAAAGAPAQVHESAAAAKRCLVRAGGLITALDAGLKAMTDAAAAAGKKGGGDTGGTMETLGEGELRRRRDLIASARKEREGLETLANSVSSSSANQSATASSSSTGNLGSDRQALFGGSGSGGKPRRVLGAPMPETDATRPLDNTGVLHLQQQLLSQQDENLTALLGTVSRQKELGVAIGEELEVQKRMLERVDADATRLGVKLGQGNRRVKKIS